MNESVMKFVASVLAAVTIVANILPGELAVVVAPREAAAAAPAALLVSTVSTVKSDCGCDGNCDCNGKPCTCVAKRNGGFVRATPAVLSEITSTGLAETILVKQGCANGSCGVSARPAAAAPVTGHVVTGVVERVRNRRIKPVRNFISRLRDLVGRRRGGCG